MKVVSFNISNKFNQLIRDEITEGNFVTKSDFFRQAIRDWFITNRGEKLKEQTPPKR